MAEETTNTPPQKDFTNMSIEELNNLIKTEGDKFIEQTKDGDVQVQDYIDSEGFTLGRLMNLFFAFDYFERTDHGSKNKSYESGKYAELYVEVYHKLTQVMGSDIYPGYIYQ